MRAPWAHPDERGSVLFHAATLTLYGIAFYVHLHAALLGLDGPLEVLCFDLGAALALGWCSGIEVGVNFHNHTHRRIFSKSRWNRWFERTWTVSGGWPAYLWKYAHVHVHHRRLGGPGDWTLPRRRADGSFESLMRYSLSHWPWRYAAGFARELSSPATSRAIRRRALRELALFAVLFGAPIALAPSAALLLWLLPAWLANVLVMGPGMYAQHAGCVASIADGSLAHSNTFRSRLFNRLMFNIGYHAEHHSHPHVHWSELPDLHRRLAPQLAADGVHVVPFGYYRAGYLLSRAELGSARCAAEWRAQDPTFTGGEDAPRTT